MNVILADLIWLFHILVIVFVLLAPFTDVPALLVLHVTFSVSLLVHWIGNNNECSLTLLESSLRGIDRTQSFTHQFIAPVYDMSKTEWSQMCYTITTILLLTSLYKLWTSPQVADAYACYKRKTADPEYKSYTFNMRMITLFDCFKELLVFRTVT